MFTLTPTFQPRYWQTEQVNACIRTLFVENYQSGVMCLSTGGGKTFEAAMIAQRYLNAPQYAGKSILCIFHRDKLVAGMRKSLRVIQDDNGNDLVATVIDANQKKIRKSLVYVAMVRTVENRIKAANAHKGSHGLSSTIYDDIGLVIIDEAHRGEHVGIERYFADREVKVIGFTATPKTASKKVPLKSRYNTIIEYTNPRTGERITGPQIKEL